MIGLGAAGSEAVRVLTAHRLRVIAFDAGRMLSAAELPAGVGPATMAGRLLARRRRVQSRSISFHRRLGHLYVDDRSNPYLTRGGDPYLWIRGRQVGGRLHTWARMALRLSDRDLQRAAEDGHGIVWPLRYADLAPFYAEVERFHGLSGARDGLAALPDGEITRPAALLAPAARFRDRIAATFADRPVIAPRVLGRGDGPVPRAVQAALDTGLLTIRTESPVARIVLDATGRRAVGVDCVDTAGDGAAVFVPADAVFCCASAIETVRLLWNSADARHPRGLGNASDQLGRHVLDHNFVVGAGRCGPDYAQDAAGWTPRASDPLDLGAELDFYLPDFCDTLADRDFVRGFGVQGRISPTEWGMGVFGEMLPDPDNRVTVADRVDAAGIPIAHIRVKRGANDRAMIARQKLEVARLAAAAGLELRMPLPKLLRGLLWRAVGPEVGVMHLGIAIHEAGGARMGDDPATSVVDADNRLWDVPNVLVTDAACFPSTGCQNPTLTIMAVSARAAARHAARVGAAPAAGATGARSR